MGLSSTQHIEQQPLRTQSTNHNDQTTMAKTTKRYALVTGANRGIGIEVVKQLASNGITTILTAIDDKSVLQAVESLKEFAFSHLVVFHQLDVTNSASIASIAAFVKERFGRLDILVNNAAIIGSNLNGDAFRAVPTKNPEEVDWTQISNPTYELSKQCLKTNYYGTKGVTNALLPLLELSDSPRLVMVSSSCALLSSSQHNPMQFPDGWAKEVLSNVDSLTEERIDSVISQFLKDYPQGFMETKGWPQIFPAYTVSKAALNGYTRLLAKKYPTYFSINCVCPGYVKTDINCHSGLISATEGAENVVRLALLPIDSPTGQFFSQKEITSF